MSIGFGSPIYVQQFEFKIDNKLYIKQVGEILYVEKELYSQMKALQLKPGQELELTVPFTSEKVILNVSKIESIDDLVEEKM
jgi:DNA-directed RNA polymerase subunit F